MHLLIDSMSFAFCYSSLLWLSYQVDHFDIEHFNFVQFDLDHQLISAHVFDSVLLTRMLISELCRYILIHSFLFHQIETLGRSFKQLISLSILSFSSTSS